ncbi:TetR family transcriptional regulator [Amycolatopsis sp. FDAARGOS 1241]|uniref:TetR family transcriptional regulator n=1 Tax=Amycolatopsis sp. FDAARGOS 1241 TaxID=2778070 RepID=UPI001950F120|nr:TetR family transcriptional regulator [Amycolatopsis sp. FDAARGOS 1241]QRP43243.1 TetR family transcriptional regulator [Amycolatopsis sp. FDAARGOS 1241]
MTIMSGALRAAPPGGGQHRQPIVAAAIELTARDGWAAVTMARLAEATGVSRQTVYNEIGSKAALAEVMISHELGRFLAVVRTAFDRHPGDLVEAIYEAIRAVLDLAEDNILLRAIASATHGTDTELLPLLTTRAGSLLTEAKTMLGERVRSYEPPLDDEQIAVMIDLVVRTVLSHVMQPSDTPERTADALAWVAGRVLGTSAARPMRHRVR